MISIKRHSAIAIWSSTIAYTSALLISFSTPALNSIQRFSIHFLKHPKQPHRFKYQFQVESNNWFVDFLGSAIFSASFTLEGLQRKSC
jgi:hypothetical protein